MDWAFWILNSAYIFYVASAVFKDMLRLRLVLFGATLLYILYGFVAPLWPLVYWNVAFGLVQGYQIFLLAKQRIGIDLNDEAEAVRVLMFADLDRPSFNLLWQAGIQKVYTDGEIIIEHGRAVDELMLILEGEVDVLPPGRDPDDPIQLGRLRLLGEMTAVSGGTARATVRARGLVRTRNWTLGQLDRLGKSNPEIEKNALMVIGNELTRKIA